MEEPRRQPKRTFAVVAVVAGAALVAFEVRLLLRGARGEVWFWLVVGLLMVAFGLFGAIERRSER